MMSPRRLTFLTSLGAALEYYDFVIYMVFIDYIRQIFFPNEIAFIATLEALAVFAAGYLARPIGGIIFGILGDRLGRKKTFISSILLMGFTTLTIGLLPSYEQIGVTSTCLLILCRLLQGLSYGAELPSAITYVAEHSYLTNRGTHNGWLFFCIALGASLSTFFGYCLTHYFSETTMLAWAWRIPFILGGFLAFVGYGLRRRVEESPLFRQHTPHLKPMKEIFQYHQKNILIGISIALCPASLIIFSLYLPYFLSQHYGYSQSFVFGTLTAVLLLSSITLPIFGWLSDHYGRKKLLRKILFIILLGIYALFSLLNIDSTSAFFCFMLLYQILITSLVAHYPIIAELFPTKVRASGVALCYNLSFSIASFVPILSNLLEQWAQQTLSISIIFMAVSSVTLLASKNIQDKTKEILV